MKLSEKEIKERVKMLSGVFNKSRYGITFSSLEAALQYTENLIDYICNKNNSLKCCGNCEHLRCDNDNLYCHEGNINEGDFSLRRYMVCDKWSFD